MRGLMQPHQLLITSLLTHAARHHATTEVVSKSSDGAVHRYTYAEAERRARRLARALQRLGVKAEQRVATLAWNDHRHLEIYYAASGMEAICHTINPRLHPDDITYIIGHAEDCILFADPTFAPLVSAIAPRIGNCVRAVVMMTDRAAMPDLALPEGLKLYCYEELMAEADEDYVWPEFDETSAAGLCYTSGTTGRPKGVLYSHRSTVLHAFSVNMATALGFRSLDRVLPVVPMFHVNAWGIPHAAPMAGAALVMPGRFLDGQSLARLMNEERVTMSAGVPTVWMGLLAHLRASGERLATVKRIMTGGSACPPLLIEAFGDEYGVEVQHGWGMTELSPVGTYNQKKPAHGALSKQEGYKLTLKQGRALYGLDMRIVDGAGETLPWDGVSFGDLKVRGFWVASAYYGEPEGSALDADGWFATGDVATIDPEGFMEITDRSKDVIKSGGEWISSIALENIAVSHPDVAEAAVVAARHPKWDERPLLLVVPKPGRTIDPQSVLQVYDGKIAKWWLPDAVLVVDELPHTATGKLQKMALRAKYRSYLEEQASREAGT
ncbi:MAG: long-chain-fatty-acid--CoA ligase [Acetobacteraceae bacterium]|nr:long-chain-fatty-acid--CoA ligase [Acetobacteraceae bacterium]